MLYYGRVQGGVVVLDKPAVLPEGMEVRIETVEEEPGIVGGMGDWDSAARAAEALRATDYDFDAWRDQRDFDSRQALDART